MSTPTPRLLLVAHGTRSADGRREIGKLLLETRKRLPGVDARLAWVDVQSPGPARVLVEPAPTVVVPAFLAEGYHVRVDVADAARDAPGPVAVTEHLGDEPELRRAVIQRLAEAGGADADAVVLAAAGSRDTRSTDQTRGLAGTLSELLGHTATAAFASAAEPTVADAVTALRNQGFERIAVATHLLAPGFFADRVRDHALEAGAAVVSSPLGAHPEIVDLVARRYAEGASRL